MTRSPLSARELTDIKDIKDYRLIIAPALIVQTQSSVNVIKEYVHQGGHLVLTVRCGMKDEYNSLLPQRQPGAFTDIAGVEVEEFYALEEPVPVKGSWFSGQSSLWAERLVVTGGKSARVIARYGTSNGWLDDQIAISVNSYGRGLVYYVGAYLDELAQRELLGRFLKTARVTTITTPPGIEMQPRVGFNDVGARTETYIVINHNPDSQAIQLPWPAYEHLEKRNLTSEFYLPAYGVAIVTPLENRL